MADQQKFSDKLRNSSLSLEINHKLDFEKVNEFCAIAKENKNIKQIG